MPAVITRRKNEPFTLRRIKVMRLFGLYNYDIRLDHPSHVTIIYGSNGTGKTTLLRLLYAIFYPSYHNHLRFTESTPFTSITLEFDEGVLGVHKTDNEIRFIFHYSESIDTVEWIVQRSDISSGVFDLSPERIEAQKEIFDRILKGEKVEPDERFEGYSRFQHLTNNCRAYYITANRLEAKSIIQKTTLNRAEQLASNLIHHLNMVRQRYLETSLYLERSFLERALGLTLGTPIGGPQEETSIKDILNRLQKIYDHYDKLQKLGILPRHQLPSPIPMERIADSYKKEYYRFVRTILADHEEKLAEVVPFENAISTFLDVVNHQLLDKELLILPSGVRDAESDEQVVLAFSVRSKDGTEIPLSKLSSGEQHRIVWAYELAFEVLEKTLVLIDEPELSMHVAWQLSFVNSIRMLGEARHLSFFVATHSPTIINGQWDMTVNLNEQHQEQDELNRHS